MKRTSEESVACDLYACHKGRAGEEVVGIVVE